MTLSLTHTKVSAIADDPAALAAGEVLPSDWNASHTLTGGTTGSVLFISSGSVLAQDNANFNWDDTSHVLTLGAASTVTASSPVFDASQTWNNGSVAFTGIRLNITNTASSAASLLQDWQVGGSSVFSIDRSGDINSTGYWHSSTVQTGAFKIGTVSSGDGIIQFSYADASNDPIQMKNTTGQEWYIGDGAGTSAAAPFGSNVFALACRNAGPTFGVDSTNQHMFLAGSTNPQSLHVYKTYTDASNYERGMLDWQTTSNTFRIMTKAAGTGTVRIIALDGFSKAGAPANTDLPSGTWALIDDTSGNQTWLVFNKAGTIRKVQLV